MDRIPAGEIEAVVSGQLKSHISLATDRGRNLAQAKTRNPVYQESDLHDAMRDLNNVWDSPNSLKNANV